MELEAEAIAPVADTAQPAPCAAGATNPTAEAMIREARGRGASHLHLERGVRGATVRLRIAGRLSESRHFPADAPLVDDIRALPDARTLALVRGERTVLRLDGGERRATALEALGMTRGLVGALLPALRRGGLVLVAGPAGSGRSTTVATLARHFAGGAQHLVAIGGTSPDGATWLDATVPAAAIRAALEQDPDIFAIDMLDDRESAAAAIEAAEAGHLVVAGIAAADSVAAIRRMREWRVEPFKLASTLAAVLAQRLVKRLCPDCRRPVQAQGSVSALLGFDPGAIVFAPTGCESCAGTGHAGETGVFEAVVADGAIRRLINDGGDEAILARHAFLRAPNLGSAARALVREGVTAPEEALRISRG